jgi:lipoate-protein ligase A
LFRVQRAAVALGSAEPLEHVDRARADAAGVEVVRRRSGGGAVLLEPGAVAWVDLVVPRGDPLWDDDVNRAVWWVGEAWVAALESLGVEGSVHRGGLDRAPWSERVCFAGLGAGEVTVGGRKVVGVSQRRTRAAARFQCAALLRWEPRRLVDLLAVDAGERAACLAAVAGRAVGVGDLRPDGSRVLDVRAVEGALLAALPA